MLRERDQAPQREGSVVGVLDAHVDVRRIPKRFVVVYVAVEVHLARRERAHRDVRQHHRRIGVDREDSGCDPVSGGVQQPGPPVEVVVPDHEDLAPRGLADPGSAGFSRPCPPGSPGVRSPRVPNRIARRAWQFARGKLKPAPRQRPEGHRGGALT